MRLFAITCAFFIYTSSLAAQDNRVISLNDTTVVNIFDNDSTFIFVELADSTMLARLNDNLEALHALLAEDRCNTCGGASTTVWVGLSVLTPILLWIAMELRGIKNKEDSHTINNTVNVPKKESHGEGDGR